MHQVRNVAAVMQLDMNAGIVSALTDYRLANEINSLERIEHVK